MKEKFSNPKNYALYLLELRDRSEGEVEEKMRRKGFAVSEIKEILSFLKSKGFLDDQKFAQKLAEDRMEYRGWGKSRIKVELIKKHINDDLIEETLSGIEPEKEKEACKEAAKKWLKRNSGKEENKKQKLIGYLARRGFSWEEIKEAIGDL